MFDDIENCCEILELQRERVGQEQCSNKDSKKGRDIISLEDETQYENHFRDMEMLLEVLPNPGSLPT